MNQYKTFWRVVGFGIITLVLLTLFVIIKFIKPHFSDEHFVAEMNDYQSNLHFTVVCKFELPVDYVTYIYAMSSKQGELQKIRVPGAGDILEDCTTGMRKVTAIKLISERSVVLVEFQNALSIEVPITVKNAKEGNFYQKVPT